MSEEILINVASRETRVGVIENSMLQAVYVERSSRCSTVGNIYKGRVQRVLSGIQAVFVDVGLEQAAFLHASDMAHPVSGTDAKLITREQDSQCSNQLVLPVSELTHEGQEIVVQVVKDPIGSKGARLTTQLSIPSRYLVLLPYANMRGVSARIVSDSERDRLKRVMGRLLDESVAARSRHGYVVRTNAEGQSTASLAFDVCYLSKLWRVVQANIIKARVGDCVYEELSLPLRSLRDLFDEEIDRVRVDSREAFGKMLEFVREFMPDLDDRVHYYSGGLPIFDLYGAEDEMQRALKKKVFLKSGGTLVIEQTEAMTTIDINSGRYLGSHDSEETAYRINLEAARMAARQLRLRNLGGIIIIDFIDMAEQEHRYQVQRALEQELARDHVKTTVYPISELGLMEMTRKRTTESLGRQLCEPCPACSGHGTVKTTETVSHEIFREIVRAVHKSREGKLLVMASTDVISRILDDKSTEVAELEASLSKTICFKAEEYYARDQFDVALL